jgi:YbgC/YbaW family acyl-CoA thioester hydrolase
MTDEQAYSTFETELQVRPDDIDMFRHVHNSKYLDYVLAARYLQMEHCYGMGMDKFLALGYGWVVKTVQVDFKRPLMMGDFFIVKTGITRIDDRGCRVGFTITLKKTNKVSADGWFDFVMIDLKTGKSLLIPQEIKQHYEV